MKEILIEEQKNIVLQILIFISEFCESNNLKYILAYGTLLGAVRHKGFIPWDDDIDIMMPRKDYEWFIENFPKHDFYRIMDYKTDHNYGKAFAVVNDIRTIKSENLRRKKCRNTVCLNVDVFPYDYLPENVTEQHILLSKIRNVEHQLACLTYAYGKGRTILSTIKKNFGISCYRLLETFHIKNIFQLATKQTELMNSFGKESNVMGCLANTGHNGIKEFLPKICFDNTILMDFENIKFRIPSEYDLYLRKIYGNYMQLPPEDQRISIHDNKCYWKD